jgi:Cu2+-containing amine oxidase
VSVDGNKNTVSEIDMVAELVSETNPYGNAFCPVEIVLTNERRLMMPPRQGCGRCIATADREVNPVTAGEPTAYKLIPFAKSPAKPPASH